tara:strand:+ start:428 stop:565 length:138 start_codon:yes stop_codon:yes gene_type:complete
MAKSYKKKSTIGKKISKIKKEGKSQKQAVAIALSMKKKKSTKKRK